MFRLVSALLFSLAATQAAGELRLGFPVDCKLNRDCFIQNYVDHNPRPGYKDFACGKLSYDGHKGTDFALHSLAAMKRGVPVLAAASGTVTRLRDGMADRLAGFKADFDGQACGNGVVLKHPDGWETQYCHMKKGSIAVAVGQQVKEGEVLGMIGLSGRTQFPHLHIEVRHKGKIVDPFVPISSVGHRKSCNAEPVRSLWTAPPAYRPGGLIALGFADHVPEYKNVRAGNVGRSEMSGSAQALVLFAYGFGGREGDKVSLYINGPKGALSTETVTLSKDQAQFMQAVGRKRSWAHWPRGSYSGRVVLQRDGRVLDDKTVRLQIR